MRLSSRLYLSTLRLLIFYSLLLLLIAGLPAHAQRVGLVLSGGGARGLAHVGVLKALEENHIPINYIAGTSMGAIIGGMYASGISPDSIEALVISGSFQQWASGNMDAEYSSFFRKPPETPSWTDLKLAFEGDLSVELPVSLVSPLQMDFVIREYFSAPSAIAFNDFNRLMIPFRTVATDIAGNRAYELRSGDLGDAIRASMTFPLYFRPIRINDVLLFDGGMTNNFPADIMFFDFFPDIIIGSKVSENYDPPTEDNVVTQLQNMVTHISEYSVICDNGVLISPEMPANIGIIDFSRTHEIIDSGYYATLRHISEIRKFVTDSLSPYAHDQRRHQFNCKKPELYVQNIQIEGLGKYQKKFLQNQFKNQKEELIPFSDIKETIFQLYSDDYVSYVFPTLSYDSLTNRFNLLLSAKPARKFHASFGGNISSSPVNGAFFGFRYRFFDRRINSLSATTHVGRFYSSLYLNATREYSMSVPFYLSASLLLSQYDYFKTSTHFFEDKTPSYLVLNEHVIDFSAGIPAGKRSKVAGSYLIARLGNNYFQSNIFTRTDIPDKTHFDFLAYSIWGEHNTLNRKQFPNEGRYMLVEGKSINGRERFQPGNTAPQAGRTEKNHNWLRFQFKYEQYFPVYPRLNLAVMSHLCLSGQKVFSNHTSTALMAPSFKPVPEALTLYIPEFSAFSFAGLGIRNVYTFARGLDLRLEGFIFQPWKELIAMDDNKTGLGEVLETRHYLASAVLVYNTLIGPASISFSYFDNPDRKFYFTFNFGYIIFNRRPI